MSLPLRPRLALAFTFLCTPDRVRLVAGEDFRCTLSGPGLDAWLPAWLPLLDGRLTLAEALAHLAPEHHAAARVLLEHLTGERLLVDGPVHMVPAAERYRLAVEGAGVLREGLQALADSAVTGPPVAVLCQDRLDLGEALHFNKRCLGGAAPWLWVSCAAGSRGYVSPLFLPEAGPCLACLFGHFRRLSPLPELYEELVRHDEAGGSFAAVSFPPPAVALLQQLVLWKADLLSQQEPPPALFRLHVLEVASLEVTGHPVLVDPECSSCRGRR
jgi:bacteriocin biosynthesis cyclodehydratase domain-containing protein